MTLRVFLSYHNIAFGGIDLYEIIFYKDKNGEEPVLQYIEELGRRSDKNSRIKFNKIQEYIQVLSEYGTQAGEPYIKHLDGEIWELRPIRERVLFAAWMETEFILLHHFLKKTQKTPAREIEQAKRELEDFRERDRQAKRTEAEAENEKNN
ncbi:MAG: type II toxin-antitoxin system RelE/ParE family toxin [Synergistaceae bacterium]|nr:type II toxin-antitoxin system RelE/ParE family toxin [Synergistaceae bacterium]